MFQKCKLPFKETKDNFSLNVISSTIYIIRISEDKRVHFYCLDEKTTSNEFKLLWESTPVRSDRVVVSSDGDLIMKSIENDLYFYSIDHATLVQESTLLKNDFKDMLKIYEIKIEEEFVVNLVILSQRLLVVCLNNRWIVILMWPHCKSPSIISCIQLDNNVSSCIANKEYVFSMTIEGALYVHKIADGTLLQRIDMWNWLAWREHYCLLDVNEEPDSLIALMDTYNTVYIFDLSNITHETINLRFDDSQSICSASSGVSYKTTSSFNSISRSSAMSVKVPSKQIKCNAGDDLWNSYLDKLQKNLQRGTTDKRLLNSVVKLESGPEGYIIDYAHFTDVGLAVYYTSPDNSLSGIHRLYNIDNGKLIFSSQLPSECCMLPISTATFSLDLCIQRNLLLLPLYSAPKHGFINKVLQCIDSRCIKMLLEGWDEMLNTSLLLKNALCESHLDEVHLALSLHSHLFKSEIVGEGLDGARTKDILAALMDVVNGPSASDQFIKQIRGLQLTHSYRLLGILDEVSIPVTMQSEVAVIRNQNFKGIVACADAIVFCYLAKNAKSVLKNSQDKLNELKLWFAVNKLALSSKTKFLHFDLRPRNIPINNSYHSISSV